MIKLNLFRISILILLVSVFLGFVYVADDSSLTYNTICQVTCYATSFIMGKDEQKQNFKSFNREKIWAIGMGIYAATKGDCSICSQKYKI